MSDEITFNNEIDRLSSKIASLRARAEAAEKEVGCLTAQRAMTVARLGGMVEGAPTHVGNFLQRIDALRAAESLADRMAEQLRDMAAQHRCGCGHPACNRCADDRENAEVLAAHAAAKGERG